VRGRRHLRRTLLLLAAGAAAAAIGLAARETGVLREVELTTVDARFAIRGTQDPPEDVVLVGVDSQTLNDLDVQPPLPRSMHAEVIDRLREAGARAVVYDFVFAEPTETEEDNALILATRRTPRLVLAATRFDEQGRSEVFDGGEDVTVGSAVFPEGTIRRVARSDRGAPTIAIVAARMATGREPAAVDDAWIDYAGPAGTVTTYSFSDVLAGDVPADRFRDRVVVVGATDPVLQDIQATSVDGAMPGAEVQANAIATVLGGFPLRDGPGWRGTLLIAFAGLVTPLAALRLTGLRWLPVPLLALAGLAAGVQLAFDAGVVLPVASTALALVVSFLATLAVAWSTDLLDRRRLRRQFARFVPPDVVDELVARSDDGVPLGGTRREGTVLFCDLRGFTSTAERMEVERVIGLLNRYLSEMSDAILDRGGTVVSYMGDGIMAVFGAPLPQDDHADRALAAAREILGERLARFNAWLREEGLPDGMRMGVGVCSGPVMSGNVGSERRMEYAAVGDTTNTAARLQAATKDRGVALLVADATRNALRSPASDLVEAGELELRGRESPVRVWTLGGADGGRTAARLRRP
jgi:adenylate cyclase